MDLREQLLAATVRVVSEQGWRGATTRRIAEVAGVNEVTLFRHFGSKGALIEEAIRWDADRAPIPTLPDEPRDPPVELLQWAVQHHAHLLAVRRHIRRTMGEFEEHPEIAVWARRVPKQLHENLEHYLVRLRDQGVASGTCHPRAASHMLLGALFADAIGRDFIPDDLVLPEDEAPRRYVELLLVAIGFTTDLALPA